LFPEKWAYTASGFPMGQNLIVGGLAPDGEDATNELSYLCLETGARLRLPQPNLSVRLHKNSPWKFRQKAAEVIRLGYGMPESFNDEIIIPALLRRGISLEDARDYAVVGCVEIAVPGKTEAYSNPANLNLPKVLEITLNNGHDPATKEKIGLSTGEPRRFKTFGELWRAFEEETRFFFIIENAESILGGTNILTSKEISEYVYSIIMGVIIILFIGLAIYLRKRK